MKLHTIRVFTFLMLVALPCARCTADGAFFGGGGDLWEPDQEAVILFVGGVEDLILHVQYEGAVGDFAWLVPTPAKPEVATVKEGLFDELLSYVFERSKWRIHTRPRTDAIAFGGTGGTRDGVTVLERRMVGVYDIAVLEATTVDALVKWCEDHGYPVPDRARKVLQSYIDRAWVFTAMRIRPDVTGEKSEKRLNEGSIQAIRFTFKTDEAIYPLQISSINRGESDVLVYTIAEDTLVNPAFNQRHSPRFEEFEKQSAAAAAAQKSEGAARFAEFYDAGRMTFRPVSPAELPATRAALPRWGSTTLYLTAHQQRFTPQKMERDVVFKAPNEISIEAQGQYVASRLDEDHWGTDPLLLRMPEALATAFEANLAEIETSGDATTMRTLLPLVAMLDEARSAPLLLSAARHSQSGVRDSLANELERAWFAEPLSNLSYDPRIGYRADYDFPSRYFGRLEALPGAPASKIVPPLVELLLQSDPHPGIARMLAALGTEASLASLKSVAVAQGRQESAGVTVSRREMTLIALRHSQRKDLLPFYHQLFRGQRESLNEREVTCCLVGLWNINDPSAGVLAREIEAYCEGKSMRGAADLARNLQVNRLLTRPPAVREGMDLAQLERELGGPGEVLSTLSSGGKETRRYGWDAGVATVKDGVVVKWKPARG